MTVTCKVTVISHLTESNGCLVSVLMELPIDPILI